MPSSVRTKASRPSGRFRPGAAHAAALVAVALWGVSFVATKSALSELSPVTLVFTRFALGAGVLVALLALRRKIAIPPRETWGLLLAMGFVGVFVHQMLQVHGLTTTTASNAGWLIALIPAWSAILGRILLGERLGWVRQAGLVIGFGGALLVVTQGRGFAPEFSPTAGDLLILASTLNWAIYTVFSRRAVGTLGAAVATTASEMVGLALLAPVFLSQAGWSEYRGMTVGGWVAVVFLGVGCSGLAYLCWYYALARLQAAQVASFLYLEPLATLAAAAALLHERPGAATLAGGVLILAGVALVQRTRGHPGEPAP